MNHRKHHSSSSSSSSPPTSHSYYYSDSVSDSDSDPDSMGLLTPVVNPRQAFLNHTLPTNLAHSYFSSSFLSSNSTSATPISSSVSGPRTVPSSAIPIVGRPFHNATSVLEDVPPFSGSPPPLPSTPLEDGDDDDSDDDPYNAAPRCSGSPPPIHSSSHAQHTRHRRHHHGHHKHGEDAVGGVGVRVGGGVEEGGNTGGGGGLLHKSTESCKERAVKTVEPPAREVLDELFWAEDELPNCETIKMHLKREGRIHIKHVETLIERVHDILCNEDNVLEIESPVTVCGDIHGQFFDFLKILDIGGNPATTRYLFLGDYVDRGHFSIEVIVLLFCYKLRYPNTFWLLRGNHECRHLTDYFTFRKECEYKYNNDIYQSFMDSFDALPLAAVINNQFFCVHGGISPDIDSIDAIKEIDRFREPPPQGPMCDFLWADPMETFTEDVEAPFELNVVRGCSFNFSFNAVCNFIERTGMLSIIRAHEAQHHGYCMHRKNEKTGFPSLITIFSAPNYLDAYNNKGAIIKFEDNVMNVRQFDSSPHPYILTDFMNVFNWSLPFLVEKVNAMLMYLINMVDDEQEEREERELNEQYKTIQDSKETLRNKVRTVSRILGLYRSHRIVQCLPKQTKQNSKEFDIRPPGDSACDHSPPTPESIRRRLNRETILQKKQSFKSSPPQNISPIRQPLFSDCPENSE